MTTPDKLRHRILDELADVGFTIQDGLIIPPAGEAKEVARRLHELASGQVMAQLGLERAYR